MTGLLFRDADVLDGSGAPARHASVAVEGDRILAISARPLPARERTIDARGLVLAPGFIDTHSHADVSPFVEPTMDSSISQGITTVIVGNCGTSAWPDAGREEATELVGVAPSAVEARWDSYAEYLDQIDAARPACNVAALVGHGAVRRQAMGGDRRPPTPEELDAMRRLVAEAVEAGALGMSTGLIYQPGIHAATEELVDLARVAASLGGLYASHIRDEARNVLAAVAEAIRIGREAGSRAHVSHLKVESSHAWGRAGELLAMLDDARGGGADVTADQYPYTAWESSLSSCLPAWAPDEELHGILRDPSSRERLVAAIEHGEQGWAGSVDGIGWERIVIGSHHPDPSITGRTVAEVAAERRVPPVELALSLILADRFTGMIGHGMLEDDVRTIAARPDVMVGTDGTAISPDGPLGGFAVHPRYYGTFPRVLGRYARDEGLLTIEDAVHKMTSLPADRFGLRDRGRIAEGGFADLVLFDPGRIADTATFETPHRFAAGIELVVVNGRVAWEGKPGERSGRALRRA